MNSRAQESLRLASPETSAARLLGLVWGDTEARPRSKQVPAPGGSLASLGPPGAPQGDRPTGARASPRPVWGRRRKPRERSLR